MNTHNQTHNQQDRCVEQDAAGRRAYDGVPPVLPVIIRHAAGDDKVAETSERVAVVETIAIRNEASIERLQQENAAMKASTASMFGEVKESLVLLKASLEVQARTQEAIAGRVDSVVSRVGALEIGLAQHKSDVDKGQQTLHVKIDGVDSGWKTEKAKLVAWVSGVTFLVSGLWSVFGGSVKNFLGQ